MDPFGLLARVPDILQTLIDIGEPWIARYGYFAIAAGMCAETLLFAGVIVPGLSILVCAGFLSASGTLHPAAALTVAVLGTITGDQLSYLTGRWFSAAVYKRLPRAQRLQQALLAEGYLLLLWYHFGPYLRALLPCAAGSVRYPWLRFALPDAVGAVLWNSAAFMLGYAAFGSLHQPSNLIYVALSGAAFAFALFITWKVYRRATANAAPAAAPDDAS